MYSSLIRRNSPRALLAVFALFTALLTSACEESVNPILESDRNYTLWGSLDMAADTQFIRVDPIRAQLDPGTPEALRVRFTSTDMNTGDERVWSDSIVTFADGSHAHVFYEPLRVQAGHRYRIEVQPEGSDVVTSVETAIPDAPNPVVLPENVTTSTSGGGIVVRATQAIVWEGLQEAPFRVEQWYRFVESAQLPFLDIRVPNDPTSGISPDDPNAWRLQLNLAHDRAVLDTMINVRGAALAGLAQQVTLVDDAFLPPSGVFDPEVLAEPGTRTNVNNGFGFVGAMGRFQAEWTLSDASRQRLRYLSMEALFGGGGQEVLEDVRGRSRNAPRWWQP